MRNPFKKVWRCVALLGAVRGVRWCAIRAGNKFGLYSKTDMENVPNAQYPVFMRSGGSSDPEVFDQIFVEEILAEVVSRTRSAQFIIDLGANVGYSSIYFLNAFPHSFVLAVEPDPENARICTRNLAPYGDRAKVVQAAIWNQSTRLALSQGAFRDGREWATQVRPAGQDEDADVEAVDMPSILESYRGSSVDLLKIDIEGAEAIIFDRNARHWLKSIRNLCVEIHSEEALMRVEDALQSFDFEYIQCGEYNVYLGITPKLLT